MRTFIALELPEEMKREIVRVQNELRDKKLILGKFTEEENLHLTLKFLGEISRDVVERVKEELEKISFTGFEVEISEVGNFGERIIWVSLRSEELLELQKEIDDKLKEFFPKEERFMSHITIARPKFIENKSKLKEFMKSFKFKHGNYVIDRLSFKKSELTKKCPIYEDILVIDSN